MTTYSQNTLKTFFQTNDVPSGTDYANFIDSCVNVAETSAQSMAGPLSPTELITPRVSATNGVFTGTLRVNGITSAGSLYIDTLIYASAAQFTGTVSAANFSAPTGRVTASAATFGGVVSAASYNATGDIITSAGTIYVSAVRSQNGMLSGSGTVSAAGTTQGAAAVLTNVINRGKGVADGVTTGFTPLANRAGLVQYLLNEGVSANLWPPTGGFINGLAVNAPFSLVTSAAYTIFHITASSYGVK